MKRSIIPVKAIQEYQQGQHLRRLAIKYKTGKQTLKKLLIQHGIKIRTMLEASRIYKVNHDYFEIIDNSEKAYWLGFLYADGNVYKNKVQLRLGVKDTSHITKFLSAISSNHPIYKDNHCMGVQIRSTKMVQDLNNLGLMPNKTFLIQKPQINKELIRHFFRGFFDGDGCIMKTKTKTFVFQINSTKSFCQWLLKTIQDACDINIGTVRKEKRRVTDCSYVLIRTTKMQTLDKIYKYFYNDATSYLERKKNKFEEILCI